MIDANSQFFAILTNVGLAKQANADALGIPWKITEMGVGDANLTDPIPSPAQTRLINEWRRRPLNQLKVDAVDPAIIIAEQVIPADEGGRWIREIGLYDADGDLVAVANCAPSYKPLMSQGSGRTQIVRMNFIVNNSGNVTLKIDPAVVLATRAYVDAAILEVLPKNKTAGEWTRVKTNDRGIVVSGDSPDTLAGMGIGDAFTKTQINAALGFKADLESPIFTGLPKASTAAAGTKSTQLATTDFVQRAVGSYSGYKGVAANTTLTAADVGKYIAAGSVGLVIQLPLGSSVFPGATFTFGMSGALTLTRQGTDLIAGPSTAGVTSIVMGAAFDIVWTGAIWQVVMGGDNVNLSANGWCKEPSGLIRQWGNGLAGGNHTAMVNSFPMAWPNACFSLVATHTGSSNNNTLVTGSAFSLSQFNLFTAYAINVGAAWEATGY